MPLPGYTKVNRLSRIIATLYIWASMATTADTPMVITGLLGQKWQENQLQAKVDDKTVRRAYHNFCAMGIHVDPSEEKPSAGAMATP